MSSAAAIAVPFPARAPVNKWLVTLSVTFGTLMGAIDTSIVAVATPHLTGALGATVEEMTWVTTGFVIATVVVMPLTAFLGRFFGQKRVYLFSLGLFVLGSALCGLARSLPMMVACRALQGLGAGALQPTEQAILRQTFPPEEQGMAMALFGLAVVVGPAAGPALGGWLLDNYAWQWIFYINLPDRAARHLHGDALRARAGRHPPREPRARRRPAQEPRLAGHRADDGRPGVAAVRAGRGEQQRLVRVAHHRHHVVRRGVRAGGVRDPRADGARARGRPVAVQGPGLPVGDADRRGDVRDPDVDHVPAAALHAAAARVPGAGVGAGSDAAGARDDGRHPAGGPPLQPRPAAHPGRSSASCWWRSPPT